MNSNNINAQEEIADLKRQVNHLVRKNQQLHEFMGIFSRDLLATITTYQHIATNVPDDKEAELWRCRIAGLMEAVDIWVHLMEIHKEKENG